MIAFILVALAFNQALLAVDMWLLGKQIRRHADLEVEVAVIEDADGHCLGVVCPKFVSVRTVRAAKLLGKEARG